MLGLSQFQNFEMDPGTGINIFQNWDLVPTKALVTVGKQLLLVVWYLQLHPKIEQFQILWFCPLGKSSKKDDYSSHRFTL